MGCDSEVRVFIPDTPSLLTFIKVALYTRGSITGPVTRMLAAGLNSVIGFNNTSGHLHNNNQ